MAGEWNLKQAKTWGVYIDNTFSWNVHVEIITKKIVRKLVVLKRVSYFMPPNALLYFVPRFLDSHFA